jgi:hypothetical protein
MALILPGSASANCKPGKPEPFASFLEAFSRDKQFAVARTEYPLSLFNHGEIDIERDRREIVKKNISKDDDAAMPSMAAFARDNGHEISTTSLLKKDATVRMTKPGTDWLYTYHFVRKNACWYLRRIEDHSL